MCFPSDIEYQPMPVPSCPVPSSAPPCAAPSRYVLPHSMHALSPPALSMLPPRPCPAPARPSPRTSPAPALPLSRPCLAPAPHPLLPNLTHLSPSVHIAGPSVDFKSEQLARKPLLFMDPLSSPDHFLNQDTPYSALAAQRAQGRQGVLSGSGFGRQALPVGTARIATSS